MVIRFRVVFAVGLILLAGCGGKPDKAVVEKKIRDGLAKSPRVEGYHGRDEGRWSGHDRRREPCGRWEDLLVLLYRERRERRSGGPAVPPASGCASIGSRRKRGQRAENDGHRRGHHEIPDLGDGVHRRVCRREFMRDSAAEAECRAKPGDLISPQGGFPGRVAHSRRSGYCV